MGGLQGGGGLGYGWDGGGSRCGGVWGLGVIGWGF